MNLNLDCMYILLDEIKYNTFFSLTNSKIDDIINSSHKFLNKTSLKYPLTHINILKEYWEVFKDIGGIYNKIVEAVNLDCVRFVGPKMQKFYKMSRDDTLMMVSSMAQSYHHDHILEWTNSVLFDQNIADEDGCGN